MHENAVLGIGLTDQLGYSICLLNGQTFHPYSICAPLRLALNMSVHLGPKVSVQSYSKVKRVRRAACLGYFNRILTTRNDDTVCTINSNGQE